MVDEEVFLLPQYAHRITCIISAFTAYFLLSAP